MRGGRARVIDTENEKLIERIKGITSSQLDNLQHKKIYFGHQSVGYNILDGINGVLRENNLNVLSIRESKDANDFGTATFLYSRIGINEKPLLKIDGFAQNIENGIGGNAAFAFFKLCFVDIDGTSDVGALFEQYRSMMASLRDRYPNKTFIHVTVPLVSNRIGAVSCGKNAA